MINNPALLPSGVSEPCKFGEGYEIKQADCAIDKGPLHPYASNDTPAHTRGRTTCNKLGFRKGGGGACST